MREVHEIFAGRCADCCCGECGRALSPTSCAQAHPPLSYALCSQHVCTLLKLNKSIAEIESTRAPDHSALNDCWQVLDTGKRLTVGKCTASAPYTSPRLSVLTLWKRKLRGPGNNNTGIATLFAASHLISIKGEGNNVPSTRPAPNAQSP